jgi:hypothetical protein
MGYRGRLINPFMVEIRRLALATMSTGSLQDPDYREPKLKSTTDRKGAPDRREMDAVRIPGQIEPDAFQRQMMKELGDTKASVFAVCFHFIDLEELGLVEAATGIALIRPDDRMSAIYKMDNETLVQTFPDPPGMYVVSADPTGYGLGGDRNLLLVRMQSRG